MRAAMGALSAVAFAVLALWAVPVAFAAFSSSAQNSGNVVTAASDFRAPQVTAVAVGKSAGGATGFVKQGGGYFVYANVAADTGSPASGTASVKANVATLTGGATGVELVAGSFTLGAVTYGYRSAALTAGTPLAEGPRSFTVTATDNAGNAGGLGGSATVDNTAPKASDVQTANGGANGLAEQGDSVTLTFSEPIEPGSALAGWSGGSTSVVVRIVDNSLLLGLGLGNDVLQIYNAANSAALPLGTVDLGRSDYVSGVVGGGTVKFGAAGTASLMTMSGSAVTIVLGSYEGEGGLGANRTTAAGAGTMTWAPTATPYDRAANAMSAATVTETGAADRDF